jgi:hypothetical protein
MKPSYSGRVSARRGWRKLNCLNPSPQGVIFHGDAAMVEASSRAEAGMRLRSGYEESDV